MLNKSLNYLFEDVPALKPACLGPVLDGGGEERTKERGVCGVGEGEMFLLKRL